ncbi:MAG: hypothetical protein WCS92_02325 [Candidatus Babeliales bacterium]|jgi:hypothetical protein|nr:MAG: hypothetical protein US22_C0054G0003 [candidate division TM6 bacterium GW2011_GWF2_36_6]
MDRLYIFIHEALKNFLSRAMLIVAACSILFLSACVFKHTTSRNFSVQKQTVHVFVQMPTSNQVYANIAPLVYDSIVEYFELVGYKISCKQSDAYTFNIIVKSLDPLQKYVSPDILLFHSTIRLELECQLLNFNQSIVASKIFYFYHLISKPKNPVTNSDFLDFEYRKLLRKAMPKIEQYFRPYLVEKCQ